MTLLADLTKFNSTIVYTLYIKIVIGLFLAPSLKIYPPFTELCTVDALIINDMSVVG